METKTLYKQNKDKSIQVWAIWTEGGIIKTSFGRLDGAMQESSKEVKQKNVGRSNETTLEEQAELEALSMWRLKKDKGYKEDANTNLTREVAPMLAQVFEKRKGKIKYPADIQPKLDGLRMLSYWEGDRVILLSRGNKEFNIPHISKQLENILPRGYVFDGEIYIHGVPFQTITSWVKKEQDGTEQLEYWVYDCFEIGNEKMPWGKRNKIIFNLLSPSSENREKICLVCSQACHDEKEVYSWQNHFVQNGFEGAVVRELDSPYEVGHRSNHLLKVKSFDDHEYKIVGFTHGDGKFSNCVIWVCIDEVTQKEFTVVPKTTQEEKEKWFKTGNDYVGQLLKVKHFGLTDLGLPRFPVGIGFRMEEDL